MARFDHIYARAARGLQRQFADHAVATLITTGGTRYEKLDAIVGPLEQTEDLDEGDRTREGLRTVKLYRCDRDLPNPEVNARVELKEGKVIEEWAVQSVESWSPTYMVLRCARPERIERGVPGYRMSR